MYVLRDTRITILHSLQSFRPRNFHKEVEWQKKKKTEKEQKWWYISYLKGTRDTNDTKLRIMGHDNLPVMEKGAGITLGSSLHILTLACPVTEDSIVLWLGWSSYSLVSSLVCPISLPAVHYTSNLVLSVILSSRTCDCHPSCTFGATRREKRCILKTTTKVERFDKLLHQLCLGSQTV